MSPFLRRVRTRTSEHIVREMVHLYQTYGVTGFMLYDDELNVNPKITSLMSLIAHTQQQLGVEFRLRGFIKAELFTDEQAACMYEAGFRWILIGFESGHHRILENIQKQASRDENTRCMEIARRHNLKVKAGNVNQVARRKWHLLERSIAQEVGRLRVVAIHNTRRGGLQGFEDGYFPVACDEDVEHGRQLLDGSRGATHDTSSPLVLGSRIDECHMRAT